MTVKTNDAMVNALLEASEQVQSAYRIAVASGHADIAAEIRRAQWSLVAAISRCAKAAVIAESEAA